MSAKRGMEGGTRDGGKGDIGMRVELKEGGCHVPQGATYHRVPRASRGDGERVVSGRGVAGRVES